VGKDSYSKQLQDAVEAEGVHPEYLYDEKTPTGRCGVIITGHDRSMVTDLAAANKYVESHLLSPPVWARVEQAKVYYVGGYHLTVCVPAILALAKEAAAKNKPFIMSLSAPFIPQFFKDQLDQTAPYWDYIIGNETEARSYAASHDLNTEDTTVIAKHLAQLPKENKQRSRIAVVTQGTDPTIVAIAKPDGSVDVKTFDVHPIDKDQINDTNGAGDAFAGGFVAGIVLDKDIDSCVHMGQWLAKLSIQELGPSYPFPKQTYTGA
jgi:adenosine kinase